MCVCMYVCMSVCMSVCPSVCLSVCMCVYVCMYVCLYVCMSVCLYVCMSVCLYVCMSVCLYVCMCVCVYHLYRCKTSIYRRGQRCPCHFLCQRSWVTCGKDIVQGRLIYVPAMVKTVDLLFLFMSCALFILWRFRFRCQTTECDHDWQFCEPAKSRNGMSIFCRVSRCNALLSQSVFLSCQ